MADRPTAHARRANHRRQREAEYWAWLDYYRRMFAGMAPPPSGRVVSFADSPSRRRQFSVQRRALSRLRLRRLLGVPTPYERKNGYPRSQR